MTSDQTKCPVAAGNATIAELPDLTALENVMCPYPTYARMRNEQPVCHVADQDLWFVTRYEDCEYVLERTDLFSSTQSMSSTNAYRRSDNALALLRKSKAYPRARTLVMTDPPDHTRFRRIAQRALMPAQTVRNLTPWIREMVDELIDGFVETGSVEFVKEFAYPLPMKVIAAILDVPDEDLDQLKGWSDDFIGVQAGNIDDARLEKAAQGVLDFEDYFLAKVEERRVEPKDDLIGRLVTPETPEDELTTPELLSMLTQLMVAGNESTTNFLGNAMNVLAQHPELQERIRKEPDQIGDLVEEILRFEAPVQGLFRTATQDAEINGVAIPRGARLMVAFGSANRDEQYYDEHFDPERDNRSVMHMTFGRGAHACLGQALARREGVLALPRLVERLHDIRHDDNAPAQRVPYFGIAGMATLPLKFTAAPTVEG